MRSALRDSCVASSSSGTTSTKPRPGGGAIRRASGGSPPSAIVKPPRIAAATLSGCPSISTASGSSVSASIGRPATARPAASPATIAALELPVPEASGTRLTSVKRRPSPVSPLARRNDCTTRLVASAGSTSAPIPSIVTSSGPEPCSTTTSLRSGSATPRQS